MTSATHQSVFRTQISLLIWVIRKALSHYRRVLVTTTVGCPWFPAQDGTPRAPGPDCALALRPLDSENAATLTSPLAGHELLLFIPKKRSVCQPWCSGCLCWIWRSCTELHGIFTVEVRYRTHNVIKNIVKMQFIVYFHTWIWYVSFPITPDNAKTTNAFLLSKASLTAILKLFLPSTVTESLDWYNSTLMK